MILWRTLFCSILSHTPTTLDLLCNILSHTPTSLDLLCSILSPISPILDMFPLPLFSTSLHIDNGKTAPRDDSAPRVRHCCAVPE